MTARTWQNRIVGTDEVAPDQLVANPKNWRTHPGNQRDALRGSLDQVGWVQQVMVNQRTGHVVDGHARVEEALSRGEATVPVLYVDLDEAEEALVLATLDPIGAMATVDGEKLRMLLAEVEFDSEEMRRYLEDLSPDWEAGKGLTDPDDVPEPPKETGIKRGDIFALGDHRLMCGDSTSVEDVGRLLEGAKPDAVVTDPPYGIDHDGITNDDPKGLGELYRGVLAAAAMTSGIFVAFHSPRMFPVWLDETRAAGHQFERMLWLHRVAAKTLPWRGWIMASDPILLSSIGAPRWPDPADWCHDTYTKTAMEDAPTGSHPTIKPVAVVADLMAKVSHRVVYEPFSGSGTTIIAAEQLGRRCYAMEIEPRYVALAIDRWEKFTGRKAQAVHDVEQDEDPFEAWVESH